MLTTIRSHHDAELFSQLWWLLMIINTAAKHIILFPETVAAF